MQDHNSLSLTCFLSVCYRPENQSNQSVSAVPQLSVSDTFWVSVTVLKTNPINQSMQYHNSRSVTHFALFFSYDLFPSFHFNSGAHAVEKGEISCQHIPFPFCPLQLAPTVQKGTLTAKVFIHSYRTCRWYETMDVGHFVTQDPVGGLRFKQELHESQRNKIYMCERFTVKLCAVTYWQG